MDIIVALILGSLGLIGWFNHLRNQRFKEAVQAKTERFHKIIDRFSSDKELLEFLQSDRGLNILSTLTSSRKSTRVPILITISAGLVLFFTGMGAFFITFTVEDDLIFGAVFLTSMALGLFAASALSYFLGKKWGVFDAAGDINSKQASGETDQA